MSPVRAPLSTLLGLLAVRWLLACSQRLLTRLAPAVPDADAQALPADTVWPTPQHRLARHVKTGIARQRTKLRALNARYQTWRNADPAELASELAATAATLRESLAGGSGAHLSAPVHAAPPPEPTHAGQDWTEQVRQRAAPFFKAQADSVNQREATVERESDQATTPARASNTEAHLDNAQPTATAPSIEGAHREPPPQTIDPRQPTVIPASKPKAPVRDAHATPSVTPNVASVTASAPDAPAPDGSPLATTAQPAHPYQSPICAATNEREARPSTGVAAPPLTPTIAPSQRADTPAPQWPTLDRAQTLPPTQAAARTTSPQSPWPSLPAMTPPHQIDAEPVHNDVQRLEAEHRGTLWNA